MDPIYVKFTKPFRTTSDSDSKVAKHINAIARNGNRVLALILPSVTDYIEKTKDTMYNFTLQDLNENENDTVYKEFQINSLSLDESDNDKWVLNVTLISEAYRVLSFISKDAVAVYKEEPENKSNCREIILLDITKTPLLLVLK